MCFGCSKEPSHRDGSFEYPKHMFWLRNKKNNFLLHSLVWGPARALNFSLSLHHIYDKVKLDTDLHTLGTIHTLMKINSGL